MQHRPSCQARAARHDAALESNVDWKSRLWDAAGVTAPPPFSRVDHLVIAVRDLAQAESDYTRMLGLTPSLRSAHPAHGTSNVLYGLANCYLELLSPGLGAPSTPLATALAAYLERRPEGVFALALGTDDLDRTALAPRRPPVSPPDPSPR